MQSMRRSALVLIVALLASGALWATGGNEAATGGADDVITINWLGRNLQGLRSTPTTPSRRSSRSGSGSGSSTCQPTSTTGSR